MKWAVVSIFGAIGLALLFFGFTWGIEAYEIYRDNREARAVIVDVPSSGSGEGQNSAQQVTLEFVAENGKTFRFQADAASVGSVEPEKGLAVSVLYDPHDPGKVRIGDHAQHWKAAMFAISLGMVVVLLSVLLFRKIRTFEKAVEDYGSVKK